MTDPLTPEDRALYDAFFAAYKAKFNEIQSASPGEGVVSLDVCTVHAIKVMVDREIVERLERIPFWSAQEASRRAADRCLTETFAAGGQIYSARSIDESIKVAARKMFEEVREYLRGPAPRIVEAVGHGVRVRRDDEESHW